MSPPRLAYLVNQYPKTSHSFVRREIAALEAGGVSIVRYSIRGVDEPLVEADDVAERTRTTVLLEEGVVSMLFAAASCALRRPLRFLEAVGLTAKLARVSDRGLVRPFAWLLEACAFERRLAREGIEHVHAHFGTNSTAVAMLAHALGGPGYSFTAHGTESFDSPPTIGLALKLERARFAVAVSEWGRAQLMRWTTRERWPDLHVVRCGVDRGFLDAPASPPPNVARIACVARLSPEKGVEVLASALGLLARDGVSFELALVGDGPLRGAIEAQLARAGIADCVRWLGWGDAAVVRREVLASRALVVPSLSEGLPVVIMEALALRRPVVATAVGAVPELVENGVTGWLVAPGSPRALADALRAALGASTGELARLGERGAARIHERHDARLEARKLAELFERALAGSARP